MNKATNEVNKINNNNYNKLAFLNPLKFLGALMIAIFLHYDEHFLAKLDITNSLSTNPLIMILFTKSFIFVEMFFVISGMLFIIAYRDKIKSYINSANSNTSESSTVKMTKKYRLGTFMFSRYKRIFPLIIITSIYMYIIGLILIKNTGLLWSAGTTDIKDLIINVLIGGESILGWKKTLNGPVWYAQILMICYALAYLVTYLESKIQKPLVNIVSYTILVILGISMRSMDCNYPLWNVDLSRGLIAFFTGMLLGIFLQYFDKIKPTLKLIIRLIALAIIGIILFLVAFKSEIISPITTYVALFLFPEVIVLLYDVRWLNNIFSNKFSDKLGAISFGIYLWNFPILITLHTLIVTGVLNVQVSNILFLSALAIIHIVVAYIYDTLPKILKRKNLK